MTEVVQCKVTFACLFTSQFKCLLGSFGHHVTTFGQVVCRYAVSPPELTADTPVLDILQPVAVGSLVFGRIELQFVVHDGRQSHVCKVLHLEEPLHREFRLDGNTRALRTTHLVRVGFHLFQQTCIGQVLLNLLTHVEAVHAHIESGCLAQSTVVVEDVDRGQVVFLAQHVVVHIVSRCHLQTTCTELNIHVIILNDGDYTVYQRHDNLLPLQPLVLRVVGVDTHGRITHDCLRTGRSHDGIASFGITLHLVAQVVEFAVLLFVDNLLVTEGSQRLGVPVHHAYTAVDEPLVVEVTENLDDTFATCLVHREGRTVPVARSTQLAQLLQNDASVFVRPFPSMFQELLTREVSLLDTLLCQFVHHLCLSSDRGVVSTGHPARIVTLHAGTTYKDVLNGIVEHVSHVEHTRHIGWRDNDGVRLPSIGFRTKKLVVKPILIPFGFHICGIVLTS